MKLPEYDWIRTLPNGDWYGYAVMEQRLWIGPDPITLDTPIQSLASAASGRGEVGSAALSPGCFNTDHRQLPVASGYPPTSAST